MDFLKKLITNRRKEPTQQRVRPETNLITSSNFTWPNSIEAPKDMPNLELRFWKADSKRITLIIPGLHSSGRSMKYEQIIALLLENNLSSIVHMNHQVDGDESGPDYSVAIINQVKRALDYALRQGNISEIMLVSTSAGGGAAAAVAGTNSLIKNIFLISPSQNVSPDYIELGLRHYHGHIRLIRSDKDPISTEQFAGFIDNSAPLANFQQSILPDAAHEFNSPREISFILEHLRGLYNIGEP